VVLRLDYVRYSTDTSSSSVLLEHLYTCFKHWTVWHYHFLCWIAHENARWPYRTYDCVLRLPLRILLLYVMHSSWNWVHLGLYRTCCSWSIMRGHTASPTAQNSIHFTSLGWDVNQSERTHRETEMHKLIIYSLFSHIILPDAHEFPYSSHVGFYTWVIWLRFLQ